ncbi:BrnT family toxin [Duganella radicis]|uniref:BrnT family toxin n=1 Tax=Duganella radicis TaxID=551988 RepID=A0A6L6PFS8_9BURK|nr:BrnT family toxin [Duganella radicis]
MRFIWDPRKAKANLRQHGVSFDEAVTAFDDPEARMEFDHLHSDTEDRFCLLARSDKDRALVVSFCYRDADVIRIISARKASRGKKLAYLNR